MTSYPTHPVQHLAPAPQAPRRVHGLALSSGIVAGVALLSSFTHVTAFLTWLPAIAAIVLAIVALVRRAMPRWLPITALVIAPLAWIIAVVVAFSGLAVLASAANDPGPAAAAPVSQAPVSAAPTPVASPQPTPSQEPVAEPEPTPTQEPAAVVEQPAPEDDGTGFIGETLTNEDNVSFTVTGARCGIPYVGSQYFGEAAAGQFCEVTGTIANWSNDPISLWSSDFPGQIGAAEYEASSESLFAGSRYSADVNPGLTVDVVLYYDVPQATNLEHVSYSDSWSFFTSDLRFWVG